MGKKEVERVKKKYTPKRAKWLEETSKVAERGNELCKKASFDALEELVTMLPGMQDLEKRISYLEDLALEIGAGLGISDNILPKFNELLTDIESAEKAGLSEGGSIAVAHVYLGLFVRNLVKGVGDATEAK